MDQYLSQRSKFDGEINRTIIKRDLSGIQPSVREPEFIPLMPHKISGMLGSSQSQFGEQEESLSTSPTGSFYTEPEYSPSTHQTRRSSTMGRILKGRQIISGSDSSSRVSSLKTTVESTSNEVPAELPFYDHKRRPMVDEILRQRIESTKQKLRNLHTVPFLATKAYKALLDVLEIENVAIVTGNSGDGKTFIAYKCLQRFMQIKHVRPFVVESHRDWKKCISPEKNLVILVKNFNGQDIFTAEYVQNLWCHLTEISQNIKTHSPYTNKVILVLRKEILQCYLPQLENLIGISMDNIIDLSPGNVYALSKDEKSKMLTLYGIDSEANEMALFDSSSQFGFPRFCQIKSVHHANPKTKILDSNDITATALANLEPEFFTILAFVCINGGKLRSNIFQDQCLENSFLNSMITLINMSKTRGATRNCLNPVEVADWLSDVYLAKCFQEGEEIYYFLHENVFHITASTILENYPETVFQFAPYDMYHFLENKAKDLTCYLDHYIYRINSAIINRIAFDIQFRITHDIFGYIADLDQWSNEKFLNVCVETHKLENSVVNLNASNQGFFLTAIIKVNNINLMRLVASYLKKKTMCITFQNQDIISIVSENGSVEMFTLLEDLEILKRDIFDLVCFKATKANNLSLMSHLMKDHRTFARDLKDGEGYSLLHYAAMSGSKEMIELLVQNGLDPNERSARNETVLHLLARNGRASDVDWIHHKYPTQISIKAFRDMSILHYAALNKEVDVIQFLIHTLAVDARERTKKDENILHLACDHGYYSVIEYISEHFPDIVQSEDVHGLNPLHKACRRGHLEAVKLLTKFEFLIEKYSRNGESVLHAACMSKSLDAFKYLFNTFPKLRDYKINEDNIILYSAAFGSSAILMFLSEQGYKVSDCNSNGENALHRACKEGNIETVKFIATKYPDLLNTIDNDGLDPMLCSVCSKSLEVVRYIISLECYYQQSSNTGQGILHIACMKSSVHVIQYICDNFPVEMQRRDIEGKLPLLLGAMNADLNVIKFLVNNGFDTNCISLDRQTVLHTACYNRNSEILRYLLKTLPSLKYRKDIRGYNLLHCACESRAGDALEILLGEGFDIRSTTFDNLTALDIAFMAKDEDIVMKLIREYKKRHSQCVFRMVWHDMSQYQSRLLESLKTYEYLDLAVSSQRETGKFDTQFQISANVDILMKTNEISSFYNNLFYFAKYETNTSTNFQERLIEIALSNPKILSWYIRVAFRFPLQISNEWLAFILHEILLISSKKIQKSIGNGICKKLESNIKCIKPMVVIHSVWAGCRCSNVLYNQKSLSSFDTLVVVSEGLNAGEIDMKTYLGIDVYFRNVNSFSKEAIEMMRYENENLSSIHISKTDIRVLMETHSNITLISASSVKSIGYDSTSPKPPIKMKTVVIYCRVKGIIPFGESMFPKHIGGFQVDVRESVVSFAAGHEGLRMGDRIEPTGDKSFGTLGGFINIDDNRLGFITCAHVVCPSSENPSSILDYIYNTKPSVSILKENGRQKEIGIALQGVFNLHETSNTSIDAALVELTEKDKFPETGHFSEKNLTQESLQQAGFEDHDSLFFCDGKTAFVSEFTRDKVLKVGATTGITRGELHYMHPEASIDQKEGFVSEREFRLSGQIEIRPLGCEYFIKKGDSGSFVFLVEDGSPPMLKCVGMAVAFTSHKTCLMTPISNILKSLNLSASQLTKFKYEYKKDRHLQIITLMFQDFEKRMMESMKTTMDNGLASVKNDLSSIENNLTKAKDDLKSDISTVSKNLAEVKDDLSSLKNRMTRIEKKT